MRDTPERGIIQALTRHRGSGYAVVLFIATLAVSSLACAQVPNGLELLFEAEFHAYEEVTKAYVLNNDPLSRFSFSMSRDLIAQGEGTFIGPRLRGTLDWSKLARKYVDSPYSSTLVSGWLETHDGAEVMYEAIGYAVPDTTHPGTWHYTATLRFEEADEPYGWLTNVAAIWIGTFDIETGSAHYRAYVSSQDSH